MPLKDDAIRIASELRADDPIRQKIEAAIEREGGSAIQGTYTAVRTSLLQAKGHLDQLRGYLNYRLYGDGARDMQGNPTLDPGQKRDAQKYDRELEGMKRELDTVAKNLRKLEGTTREMDEILRFN